MFKNKFIINIAIAAILLFSSCKKETTPSGNTTPTPTIADNYTGDFILTDSLFTRSKPSDPYLFYSLYTSSPVPLSKINDSTIRLNYYDPANNCRCNINIAFQKNDVLDYAWTSEDSCHISGTTAQILNHNNIHIVLSKLLFRHELYLKR